MKKFDELLNQLNALGDEQAELAKAIPAQSEKDALPPGVDPDADPDEEEDENKNEENFEPDKSPLAKALPITVGDEEYYDATEVIKSLQDRLDGQDDKLLKSFGSVVDLILSQGVMLKSLVGQVNKLSSQGRGRKTVLNISEPPMPAGQQRQAPVIGPQEIMAKALDAQTAGKLSAIDVSRCEISLQSGMAVPADILTKLQ